MKKSNSLKFRCEVNKMRTRSYLKRRNASVISLSPDFNGTVRRVRSDLGIPAEGFGTHQEMDDWYKRHHAESTEEPYRPSPDYYWHFPQEFVELVESFSYSDEPSRVNYYPRVPLDRCAMDLTRKFDLPEEVVDQVKAYILGTTGPLGIGPALQLILIPVNESGEGIKYVALVAGIDEATTRKDWLEVWRSIEVILRLSGVSRASHRRPLDNLLLRDLSFWEKVKAGKTAKEVLDDWTKRHPEDEHLGEDTVRKAVSRIDKVMQPNFSA